MPYCMCHLFAAMLALGRLCLLPMQQAGSPSSENDLHSRLQHDGTHTRPTGLSCGTHNPHKQHAWLLTRLVADG
jgi:hypothetical protein